MPRKKKQNPPIKFVTTNPRTNTLTQKEINELHRAGYLAGWRDHLTIEACPYRHNPEAGTTYDEARAAAWVTGFSASQTDLEIYRKGKPVKMPRGAQPY